MTDFDDRFAALEARLRQDAARFGGAPSAGARAALSARLRSLDAPRPRRTDWLRPRWLRPMAAAIVLAALLLWCAVQEPPPLPAEPRLPSLAPRAAALALRPLEDELAGLRQDGVSLARGLWVRVPAPVRQLFH